MFLYFLAAREFWVPSSLGFVTFTIFLIVFFDIFPAAFFSKGVGIQLLSLAHTPVDKIRQITRLN